MGLEPQSVAQLFYILLFELTKNKNKKKIYSITLLSTTACKYLTYVGT